MTGIEITGSITISPSELEIITSRSSGPGGQNVNKLETRVEIRFNVHTSRSLSESQKKLIAERLGGRMDEDGVLRVVSQESRSQWRNKQIALEQMAALLQGALKPRKKRKPTKPTKSSREQRLKAKKRRSETKRHRQPPSPEL